MYRTIAAISCALCLLSNMGCAGFWEYRRDRVERQVQRSNVDAMWEQGYGFNNPNNERRREGLDPVDFSGQTEQDRRAKHSFLGDLLGDLLGYGIKSSFSAVGRAFRRH